MARDGREHIEYVPSQVVTEFVRSRSTEKDKIDGIRYPSAVQSGKVSYVFFADSENVIVPDDKRPSYGGDDRWLELVARTERQVSEEDLARWKAEIARTPIGFSD